MSEQSQYTYYNSALNSRTNITSVEETASRLGLMKIDQSQITYIRLDEGSVLVRKESAVRQWTDLLHDGAMTVRWPLSNRQNKTKQRKACGSARFFGFCRSTQCKTILQEPKRIYYRAAPQADPHERLSARLRHFSFGAAVFFVVAAAADRDLQPVQDPDPGRCRPTASTPPEQQLLDSTIQATRGEIYDTSRHHAGFHQRGLDHLGRPQLQHGSVSPASTDDDTKAEIRTIDDAALKEVSTQITLRLLSGDGESLDSVDTSSAEYQTQYQTVYDALSQNDSLLSGAGHQGQQRRQALH